MIESKVVMKEEMGKDEYPRLMISSASGNVVLFAKEEEGVVVSLGAGHGAYKIGDVVSDFNMVYFSPFHGEVILVNK